MVQQHVRGAQALAAGIAALPDTRSSASYTQAAWRFLNNPRVTLPELARPLLSAAGPLLDEHCEGYGLVMHDWSRVNFGGHASKVDRRQMTHKTDVGYELQSSVLVSDVSGKPLAPVVHNLVNDTQVYSTMHKRPRPCEKHLDELSARLDWIDARGWNKPLIHIVDREADSVAHWREWSAQGRCFLIRAKNAPAVYFEGQQVKPMDLAERLTYQRAGDVLYKGRPACQSVAEVRVVITRKAKPAQKVDGKRVAPIAGKPLALRLVVSRIHDAQGKLLAHWLLLTNAPDAVDAQTIARWYYYRWQIESMFKLLKGAGQQMEDWLLAVEHFRANLAAKKRCQHGSKRDTAALTAIGQRIAPTPRQGYASPGCIRPQPALDPATGLVPTSASKHFSGLKKGRRQISAEMGRHQHWLQDDAMAIAKRLVVASCACVLVW